MNLENEKYESGASPLDYDLAPTYVSNAFTKTEDKVNLEIDNANISCLTSKNNKFSLDDDGNLVVNSLTCNNTNSGNSINLLDVYPIGSIYFSVNDVNPNILFGGTWEAWGTGRCPIGIDSTQTEFSDVEKTGGTKTVVLTESQIPSHKGHLEGNAGSLTGKGNVKGMWLAKENVHINTSVSNAYGWNYSSNEYYPYNVNRGGGQAHNNLPPYITCYMWKRVA